MTTIAFRDGVLAADTASWDANGVYFGQSQKLFRLNDGRLFGAAGSKSMALRVVNWLNGEGAKPETNDEKQLLTVQALLVSCDGELWYMDSTLTPDQFLDCPFAAIGSGRELALGAMAMGASAERAVEVACQFDNCSRLPLTTLRF